MGIGRSGLVLAALMVTACGTGSGVVPTSTPAVSSTSSSSSVSAGLPRRPAELSLTGVDPCALLGSPQLDQLKVNSNPRGGQTADGPTCTFDVDKAKPYYSYGLTEVSSDLEAWLSGDRRKNSMTTEPTDVDGFPALTSYRANSDPTDCSTVLGVAGGQSLVAQAFPVTGGAFTQQQLCALSRQAANLALQTLKARK